jgi:hypothetical protein
VSPWVRVTHLPTGLQADCHQRVRPSNPDGARTTALRILRAKLWLHHHDRNEPTEPPLIREYSPVPDSATYAARKEHIAALARALDLSLRDRSSG